MGWEGTVTPGDWARSQVMEHEARLRAAGLFALQQLVLQSPVGNPSTWKSPAPRGYVGGRFRANWHVSFGRTSSRVYNTTGRNPLNDAGVLRKKPRSANDLTVTRHKTIHIQNNLPYAVALAEGHSPQAPAGWVNKVLRQTQVHVDRRS